MKTVRPLGALVVVVLVIGVLLMVRLVASGQSGDKKYLQVGPDASGVVRIGIDDLENLQVRFYRFINRGNQEVLFFIGRDETGTLQVAFDAGESHHRLGRGFTHQGAWVIDNKCERASRLSEVNQGGSGCKPTPLDHRVAGSEMILQEGDILKGWRYFR